MLRSRIATVTPRHEPTPEVHHLHSADALRQWLRNEKGLLTQAEQNEQGGWLARVAEDFSVGTAGIGADGYELIALTEAYRNWLIYRRAIA